MSKIKFHIKATALYFILGSLCAVALWTERPRKSEVIFEENVRPGQDRLFVPVRTAMADSLFTVLTGGNKKTAKVNNGLFVVNHLTLGQKLGQTRMGEGLWEELCEVDPHLYRSADGNKLCMSMGKDKDTGEEFVWVPAGIFSLFVK